MLQQRGLAALHVTLHLLHLLRRIRQAGQRLCQVLLPAVQRSRIEQYSSTMLTTDTGRAAATGSKTARGSCLIGHLNCLAAAWQLLPYRISCASVSSQASRSVGAAPSTLLQVQGWLAGCSRPSTRGVPPPLLAKQTQGQPRRPTNNLPPSRPEQPVVGLGQRSGSLMLLLRQQPASRGSHTRPALPRWPRPPALGAQHSGQVGEGVQLLQLVGTDQRLVLLNCRCEHSSHVCVCVCARTRERERGGGYEARWASQQVGRQPLTCGQRLSVRPHRLHRLLLQQQQARQAVQAGQQQALRGRVGEGGVGGQGEPGGSSGAWIRRNS